MPTALAFLCAVLLVPASVVSAEPLAFGAALGVAQPFERRLGPGQLHFNATIEFPFRDDRISVRGMLGSAGFDSTLPGGERAVRSYFAAGQVIAYLPIGERPIRVGVIGGMALFHTAARRPGVLTSERDLAVGANVGAAAQFPIGVGPWLTLEALYHRLGNDSVDAFVTYTIGLKIW